MSSEHIQFRTGNLFCISRWFSTSLVILIKSILDTAHRHFHLMARLVIETEQVEPQCQISRVVACKILSVCH